MIDFSISDLRIVVLVFKGKEIKRAGHSSLHYMHKDQVDPFVQASIKLHHLPGKWIEKEKRFEVLANLWEVRLKKLHNEEVSHWWCGAAYIIQDFIGEERLWAHPDLIALDEEADRLEGLDEEDKIETKPEIKTEVDEYKQAASLVKG